MPAGYSKTPLVKKLGIKSGFSILLVNAPDHYCQLVDPLPENLEFIEPEDLREVDFIHYFTTRKSKLSDDINWLKLRLKKDAMLWVSWPKAKSKIPKDIDENGIREVILPLGLVDIKVCAVDEDWSGLKLVYRKSNR